MDAVLIDEELVSRDRLRELQRRSNGASAVRLVAQVLLYLGSAAALVWAEDPVAIATLLLVNGVIQFGFFGMLHEACHNTAFRTRGLNLLAGWIAALAQPMSPALMRAFHFEHHRHTHELERDPELGGLAFMARWPRGSMWLITMTGISLLVARSGWTAFAALVPKRARLWDRVLPFVPEPKRRRVAWEARVLLAIHGLVIAAAVVWLPALGRIYLGMLLGHTFLAWYVTCEHRGLPQEGSVLERTRSLRAPAWLRWLVWNMPYHAEHHAWPAVPWHALPQLHAEVGEHLVHVERPLYLHLHGGRERKQLG